MTNNTVSQTMPALAAIRTYAREVAQADGALTTPTWDGLKSRLSSLDARDAQNAFARHLLVLAPIARGAAQKDVASALDVGSSQITNMRRSVAAWEQVGLSDDAVAVRVTVAGVSKPSPVWTLFTNPDRGIRDHAGKSDAWSAMLASLTPDMGDAERIAAVVAYVDAYVKPEATPDTFVDKMARVAKAAESVELSREDRAAVAQMLLDIASAIGITAPADARDLVAA